MLLLYALSWISIAILFCFLFLCLAAGLAYLTELVEEKTKAAIKVIEYIILGEYILYVALFLFDSFGWIVTFTGLGAHICYHMLLRSFPQLFLLSPAFLASLVLFFANNYFALQHFGNDPQTFAEVLGFFVICNWLTPFCMFALFSSTEGALPFVLDSSRGEYRRADADVFAMGDADDVVSQYLRRNSRTAKYLRIVAPFWRLGRRALCRVRGARLVDSDGDSLLPRTNRGTRLDTNVAFPTLGGYSSTSLSPETGAAYRPHHLPSQ